MADNVVNIGVKMILITLLIIICPVSEAWIHNLKLLEDDRPRITLTRPFGFLKDGTLAVNVSMFSCNHTVGSKIDDITFGFTLDKTTSPGLAGYMETAGDCVFNEGGKPEKASIFLRFDLRKQRVVVERGNNDLVNLTVVSTARELYLYQNGLAHGVNPDITQLEDKDSHSTSQTADADSKASTQDGQPEKNAATTEETEVTADQPNPTNLKDTPSNAGDEDGQSVKSTTTKPVESSSTRPAQNAGTRRRRRAAGEEDKVTAAPTTSPTKAKSSHTTPGLQYLPMSHKKDGAEDVYQTYFLVHIKTDIEEGLYSLIFHNCYYKKCAANLALQIIQDNNGNYLSADEMPIPALFFLFSVVFFIQSVVWFSVLRRAEEGVYKIHYLMLVVVFFKCLSSLFHGVNMHMIQLSGIHVDAWAILWYIVYLMKGAVMFVTVLLIGAGWAFIKHVFSHREKKLFLIVLPLQILLNVAWVIVEESEEGYSSYNTWSTIFIGVDLVCCFAILFPVIWSIRHLQEASRIDGKAAINLNKLKLFRHFYILVVAYIYSTRIIKYLLHITLPFRFGWMEDLFEEVFLLVFFTMTGYKFRPTSDNPYLQVPLDSDDEEEIEMDEVMTKSGATETVVRVNQGRGEKQTDTSTKQRESSHEYD